MNPIGNVRPRTSYSLGGGPMWWSLVGCILTPMEADGIERPVMHATARMEDCALTTGVGGFGWFTNHTELDRLVIANLGAEGEDDIEALDGVVPHLAFLVDELERGSVVLPAEDSIEAVGHARLLCIDGVPPSPGRYHREIVLTLVTNAGDVEELPVLFLIDVED